MVSRLRELNLNALATTAIHQKKDSNCTGDKYISGIAYGIYFTLHTLGYKSEKMQELDELFN